MRIPGPEAENPFAEIAIYQLGRLSTNRRLGGGMSDQGRKGR